MVRKTSKRSVGVERLTASFESNEPRVEALQAAARDKKSSQDLMDIKLTHGCSQLKDMIANVTQKSADSPPWLSSDEFLANTKCGKSNYLSS